jgi:hypothetical protein
VIEKASWIETDEGPPVPHKIRFDPNEDKSELSRSCSHSFEVKKDNTWIKTDKSPPAPLSQESVTDASTKFDAITKRTRTQAHIKNTNMN